MKNFQLIILVVFAAGAVLGILVFSGAIKIGGSAQTATGQTVVLWGTISQQAMASSLDTFNRTNTGKYTLRYVQKDAATFDNDLLEALASGTGPDMFFLPNNLIYHYLNRISLIPYQSFPLASFQTAFVGAGEVFLTSKGILALPLFVDPMVMYYNRSILDNNNIVAPPATWDDLDAMVPTLTQKDPNNKITQSTVALGTFTNVTNAKDILANLFMQYGNPIISEKNGAFYSTLGGATAPTDVSPVLKFYTDFADPLNPVYSWNESLPNSIDAFTSENLAFYFGYASELPSLLNRNPNENFLPAPMPQLKNASSKSTMAQVTGIAISSFSKNPSAAFAVASMLAMGTFPSQLAAALYVAPARRDLLAVKPTDAYFPTFYSSALFAKSWVDPSPTDTDDIFSNMVTNVLSGNMSDTNAVSDASSKLQLLLNQ